MGDLNVPQMGSAIVDSLLMRTVRTTERPHMDSALKDSACVINSQNLYINVKFMICLNATYGKY